MVIMKNKRFKEWFRKNVVVKELDSDKENNFDERSEYECL